MNVPFLCVALTFVLIYVPRAFVARGQAKLGYDNRNPREQQARLEGVPKRAHAAHMNAFEDFAPFAASVVLAHLAKVPDALIVPLSSAHVALRAVYLALYIGDKPMFRSAIWVLGFLTTGALFGLAVVPR